MRRWAAAVVILAGAGCASRTAPREAPILHSTAPGSVVAPAPAVVARDVAVVGDSLTVGTEPFLADALARRGLRLRLVDAEESRRVEEGLEVLADLRHRLPSTVVVALGTNNLGATASEVERWVAAARAIVGDRTLVWINLVADHPGAYRINRALARAAAEHGVEVADWQRWSARRGVEPRADGIHYDEDAYRLRAAFYAAAVTAAVRG